MGSRVWNRCTSLLLLWISAVITGTASGAEVLGITGPSVVVNGSTPLLVLDCEYNLTESDKEGLVVKWYYNRQPFPIYQWIPNNSPQDLGILKGRLLLDYAVSDDVYKKHRALAIRNPTTELTGEYTCWLSSFASEDFKRKKLIVYAPARNITMTYSKSQNEDSVVVTCQANGVSPRPEIAIFRSDVRTQSVQLEGAYVETRQIDDSYFNISVNMEIFDSDLHQDENMFKCVLSIPDTDYEEHRMILYSPGPPTTTSTTTTPATTTTAYPATIVTTNEAYDVEEENDDEENEDENGENDNDDEDHVDDDDDDDDDNDVDHSEVVEDQPHVAESVSGSGKLATLGSVGLSGVLLVFFLLR